jgi:hypothetical protein
MINYTALISFKIAIEAEDIAAAEHITKQALPHHFDFSDGKGGSGKFLRGLTPVVYEQEDEGKQYDSYWRNR